MRFYEEFKNSKETHLAHFMLAYQPPITPEHHTCVGLGLALLSKLKALDYRFPGLASKTYVVSCEEAVEDIFTYVKEDPNPTDVEKEHIMIALKLEIAGRKGLLLLDPGYHVARVVTVMEDELYPHTGWFTQIKEEHCRKDYNYSFSTNSSYVLWRIRERRGNSPEQLMHSAVYVDRPFLSAVNVTERRNLVYNFRSLLARNTKGHLTAGIHFPVLDNLPGIFTMFYTVDDAKKRVKLSFNCFKSIQNVDEELKTMVEDCNKLLGFPPGQLFEDLHRLANILSDTDFTVQMLLINKKINEMSENN